MNYLDDQYRKQLESEYTKNQGDKYNRYQSQEWVNIQNEIDEDENSGSIMDEFKIN